MCTRSRDYCDNCGRRVCRRCGRCFERAVGPGGPGDRRNRCPAVACRKIKFLKRANPFRGLFA